MIGESECVVLPCVFGSRKKTCTCNESDGEDHGKGGDANIGQEDKAHCSVRPLCGWEKEIANRE